MIEFLIDLLVIIGIGFEPHVGAFITLEEAPTPDQQSCAQVVSLGNGSPLQRREYGAPLILLWRIQKNGYENFTTMVRGADYLCEAQQIGFLARAAIGAYTSAGYESGRYCGEYDLPVDW